MLQRMKSCGVCDHRDVSLKSTDPNIPKTANLDRLCDQRLLPCCPVARVYTHAVVLPTACAASSGHLGLSESAEAQWVTDMSLGSSAMGSKFTERSRSTEGQTTKEGSNTLPPAECSTDVLPHYQTPGCSAVDGALPGNHVTLPANPVTLPASHVTLQANHVTLPANPVTAAKLVTLAANPDTLTANPITLAANPDTLTANPVNGDTRVTATLHSDAPASRSDHGKTAIILYMHIH